MGTINLFIRHQKELHIKPLYSNSSFCKNTVFPTDFRPYRLPKPRDQFGTGKTLSISQELLDLLANWKSSIGDEGYILRSISRHGHIGENLNPASISTILKALQKGLNMDSNEQPLSGHSFRVGAALDLLEQGEPLERIMLRGGWQTDSTAMSYLRNWIV